MSLTQRTIKATAQGFSITQMTEHDLLEVVEIEETTGLSRWGWAAYYSELQGQHNHLMLVARVNDNERQDHRHRLAGYIVARMGADELHINNVAVRDRYRGCGIGLKLLNSILTEGARSGAGRAYLELRAGNAAALALYEKCGFQVTARRARYYSEPTEDALVMTVQLQGNA
jgi:[ribosomal protein S18]-alanine N-acetyltransferase